MLTHFGNFLCSIAEKEPFKTDSSLWCAALRWVILLYNYLQKSFATSTMCAALRPNCFSRSTAGPE